jgi:hypothetical protein
VRGASGAATALRTSWSLSTLHEQMIIAPNPPTGDAFSCRRPGGEPL